MNQLEELSKQNRENYQRYLKRMTESIRHSTKGFLPLLCKEGKRILDVGCGSGVLLFAVEQENPTARLTGLDLNAEAIAQLSKLGGSWELIHDDFMNLSEGDYDTIVFSSILHEISSYHSDTSLRFGGVPIRRAIQKCRELLPAGGSIILRDGVMTDAAEQNRKAVLRFKNPEEAVWLSRFQADFRGFDATGVDREVKDLGNGSFLISKAFLKEFLCTYTWGAESYPREVCERFGVLTRDEWMAMLSEEGFSVETVAQSKEEYERFLSESVMITEEDGTPYGYPFMSIIIKAVKRV